MQTNQITETKRQGRLVMRDEIESVVRALDDQLFLFSPRFEAARAALAAGFLLHRQVPEVDRAAQGSLAPDAGACRHQSGGGQSR